VLRPDNLTTFMCRLSWNLGASTSWCLQGLSRPVMGLFYLFLVNWWILISHPSHFSASQITTSSPAELSHVIFLYALSVLPSSQSCSYAMTWFNNVFSTYNLLSRYLVKSGPRNMIILFCLLEFKNTCSGFSFSKFAALLIKQSSTCFRASSGKVSVVLS